MKKRDLELRIKKIALDSGSTFYFVGGTKHDKYLVNGKMILIPRHREINELTAKGILDQARKYAEEGGKN